MHPILGSRFGLPAQTNQPFHPPGYVGESLLDMSEKDTILLCLSAGHSKPFCRPNQIASMTYRRSVIECVAHPKMD